MVVYRGASFDLENPDIRYRFIGGNSGYIGYSMSKRAAEAKEFDERKRRFERHETNPKVINGYWYNADNHVSLQLSDDNFFVWRLQKLLKTLDFQKIGQGISIVLFVIFNVNAVFSLIVLALG